MLPNRYITEFSPDRRTYEFTSIGPRGSIRKIIRFQETGMDEMFNLALVDVDAVTGRASDTSVSDNGDRDKVLTTVAAAVADFLEQEPYAEVFATGSTPIRTRLYRIAIANNWTLISESHDVFGLLNDSWQPFKSGIDYTAFLIRRKPTFK